MKTRRTGYMAAWAVIINLVLFFALSNSVLAKPSIHLAVKGDSLRTISEAYYGDPNLWRELWKINPSIVNPGRIAPGFAVILFDTDSGDDTPREAAEKDVELLSVVNKSSSLRNTRIDVSSYTTVNAMGFLSPEEIIPCGTVISDETERIFLAEGDMGCVAFEEGVHIKPGDAFTVYQSSQPIGHPITSKAAGYNISFLGKVVVKNKVRDNVYQAEIMESYRTIRVGDPLIRFTRVSPCVQLQELAWDLLERNDSLIFSIVEAKDLQEILGKLSVVYLDRGYKQGVRRGNFFQVVDNGDLERQSVPGLPYLIRGYVLILESRPDTSTGVVVYSTRDFHPGALLRAVNLKSAFFEILLMYKKEFRKIVIEKGTSQLNLLEILESLERDVEPKPDLPEGLRVLMHMPRCSDE